MKNTLMIASFLCFLFIGLSSCSKGDTCDYGGGVTNEYSDLSNKERKMAKDFCESTGGTWK